MGYSAEVVKRARARLAEAKADRESEISSIWPRPMASSPGSVKSTVSCA